MDGWNIASITASALAITAVIVGEVRRIKIHREARALRALLARLVHPSAQERS